MKSKIFTTSLLASALFAGLGMAPAMAQNTSTPQVDRAQQAISARIQQGLNSGHITPSEQRSAGRDRPSGQVVGQLRAHRRCCDDAHLSDEYLDHAAILPSYEQQARAVTGS